MSFLLQTFPIKPHVQVNKQVADSWGNESLIKQDPRYFIQHEVNPGSPELLRINYTFLILLTRSPHTPGAEQGWVGVGG